jgi:EAL domain-containing protein (putative c-di-GMP-specific phosphodiesterase class I)
MSEPRHNDAVGESLPRIAIAEAISQNWCELWYQPKIDLKRKCLAGAEALARFRHPEHGVLEPGRFVPEVDTDGIAKLAEYARSMR